MKISHFSMLPLPRPPNTGRCPTMIPAVQKHGISSRFAFLRSNFSICIFYFPLPSLPHSFFKLVSSVLFRLFGWLKPKIREKKKNERKMQHTTLHACTTVDLISRRSLLWIQRFPCTRLIISDLIDLVLDLISFSPCRCKKWWLKTTAK